MASARDFTLTNHAIERLRERDENFPKLVDNITSTSLKLKATYDYVAQSTEEKSFLNNSIFMTKLGEKYGFDRRYYLFVRDDLVFVGVSGDQGNAIVTVLKKSEHYLYHVRETVKKFEKRPKKMVMVEEPMHRKSRGCGTRRYGK
jgi:hypothetical protein